MGVQILKIKNEVYEAIRYYTDVTGETSSQFIEGLKEVEHEDDDNLKYEAWLRKQIIKLVKSNGVSVDDVINNKDMLMGDSLKEEDGSFYTPVEWAKETHEMILRHIPNLEDYVVWDASCGSGNLVQDLPKCKQLYLSTLHEEDVEIAQERVPHAHVFQLDFLSKIDYNPFLTEFTDNLPQGLQDALRNNDPILFLMNPPYAVTNAHKTQLANHLRQLGESEIANDLLRQFIWRVYNLTEIHNLTNSHFACIGTNSLFILPSWESTLRTMHEHADYLEGFTFPAGEFPGIEKSVKWGIYSTLWKTVLPRKVESLPTIQLDEKKKDKDGNIITLGKMDFVWNRDYAVNWLKKKITVGNRIPEIVLNVRGEPTGEDGKPKKITGLDNALGYFMFKGSFKDITQFNSISTVPISAMDIAMTLENVKDSLATFAFNTNFQEDFYYSARSFREPVTGTDEYKEWVANSIFFAICSRKSFVGSFRGIQVGNDIRDINSTFFPYTSEQVKEFCTDPIILEDLENNPIDNQWYLDLLEESEPYLWDSVITLYKAVTDFIRMSYDYRKTVDYAVHTKSWNASFNQLKQTGLWNEDLEKQYGGLLGEVRKDFRSRMRTHFVV